MPTLLHTRQPQGLIKIKIDALKEGFAKTVQQKIWGNVYFYGLSSLFAYAKLFS